jgi:hypothetical protein
MQLEKFLRQDERDLNDYEPQAYSPSFLHLIFLHPVHLVNPVKNTFPSVRGKEVRQNERDLHDEETELWLNERLVV